jgi:hypothetical protein
MIFVYCLECFSVVHIVLPFIIFIHMHLASHLGTLGEPREGRDVGIKPKTVLGSLIPKM